MLIAEQGFDLWINNSRGNKMSRLHTQLDPDCHEEFWDFSFQEMADFDQPALFDYVIKKTGAESVTYIGHSQGTTQMLAALCDNYEFFKSKLNLVILLAPVARVDRMTSKALQKAKTKSPI